MKSPNARSWGKRIRAAVSLTLLCTLLGAQTPTPRPVVIPQALTQVVAVDAYVTDQKGRPVTDLRLEDFELFEDNRPVPIVAFEPPYAVVDNSPVPAADRTAEAPGVTRRKEPLTVAIFVDRWLLSPPGRKRALDQAATLAERLIEQGARVVVIAEEKSMKPLTPLTTDPAVVRSALAKIQEWSTQSPGMGEGRSVMENVKSRIEIAENTRECDPDPRGCICVLSELVSMIRGYATFRGLEVQTAANRLAFLVNALAGLSGRKALIYVSEGLEQRPGVHLFDQLTTICPEALQKDASSIYGPMQEMETSQTLREATARANAARVTFYPIDARGLSGLSGADIESNDRRYVAGPRTDAVRDANLTNPYRLLADETGGFAMIRGMDPGTAMKRFDADAQGHYVLGFNAGEPDSRTHGLRVDLVAKVRAKRRVEIRHRQSYYRAEMPAQRGQRALSALVFGLEENGLNIEAAVERTGPTTARVRVGIALAALRPIADLTPAEGRVQVVVSFRSTESEKSPVTVRENGVAYALTPAEMAVSGGRREIVIEVPVSAERYEFAIGVEDVASGVTSYVRKSLVGV